MAHIEAWGMKGTRLLVRLERRLSGRRYRALGDALTLLFLLVFVVGPPLSLFPSVLRSWGEVYTTVFADP
ncbi:MAG: hypothetical protein ACETVR_04120, partial [Candidatus Bathyarchaeia archaeon]